MSDLHNEFKNSRFFNADRMDRRSADVVAGLATCIAADGVVTIDEAKFLRQWIETQLAHLYNPLINLLYQRINLMLEDDKLDAGESSELLDTLRGLAGLSVASSTGQSLQSPPPPPAS